MQFFKKQLLGFFEVDAEKSGVEFYRDGVKLYFVVFVAFWE